MPIATIQGVPLYYEVHGRGTPLLLIEGFACNRWVWEAYIPSLQQDFQLIVFDNRGCGQSGAPPGPYSMEMLAQDTVGLLNFLNIPRTHILGHSMGGMILQQICLSHPEKVDKAIICASCAKVPEKALRKSELLPQLRKWGVPKEWILRSFLPWILSNAFLRDKNRVEALLQKMLHDPYPQTPEGYLAQTAALRSFNVEKCLKNAKNPTLVIGGEEDILTPFACSEFLAQHISGAQLIKLPGQAHFFIEEARHEVLPIIKNFLLK